MSTKFKFLTGDVNYRQHGGTWYRQVNESVYHVVELINMWDATGEEDQPQYAVELKEIDLDNTSEDNIRRALECCGWNDLNNVNPLMIVESLSSYGCFAPMGNWSGNNYRELIKAAKRESYNLGDEDYHEAQMSRPVNKIGSTAREYQAGDTTSAMIRSIARGDIVGRIMGKMHGLKDEDLDQVASDPANKDFSLTD